MFPLIGTFNTFYYYNQNDVLIGWFNEETNTTYEMQYDENGNRKRLTKKLNEKNENLFDYNVNNCNQYLSNGQALFEYNTNGDVNKVLEKDNIISFDYYEDGKVSLFKTTDDSCSINYDCLERVSEINCLKSGNYSYSYHVNPKFDKPYSVKLPNNTIIYFIQFPAIGIIGFVMESKYYFIEKNENFHTSDIFNKDENKGKVNTYYSNSDNNPFKRDNSANIPFNIDTFKPHLGSSKFYLNDLNKPFSLNDNREFGLPLFNSHTLNPYEIEPPSINLQQLDTNINTADFGSYSLKDFKGTNTGLLTGKPIQKLPNSKNQLTTNDMVRFHKKICNMLNLKPKKNHEQTGNQVRSKRIVDKLCAAAVAAGTELLEGNGAVAAAASTLPHLVSAIPVVGSILGSMTGVFIDSCKTDFSNALRDGAIGLMTGLVKDKLLNSLKNNLSPGKIMGTDCLLSAAELFVPDLIDALLNISLPWGLPKDPNDINGPIGYGPENFICSNERLKFRIRFENIETAAAPAQVVRISSLIHENFDFRSISFTGYGFNDFEKYNIDYPRPYIDDLVQADLIGSHNVKIQGFVNSITRSIHFVFKTIDKTTGISLILLLINVN